MKLQNEVRERLNQIIEGRPDITREELAEEIKRYENVPDALELIEREYLNTASRFLGRHRDKRGHRIILANREKSKFVNIEVSNNQEDLAAIEADLIRRKNGYDETLFKLKMKKMVMDGQITMSEYLNYSGETSVI